MAVAPCFELPFPVGRIPLDRIGQLGIWAASAPAFPSVAIKTMHAVPGERPHVVQRIDGGFCLRESGQCERIEVTSVQSVNMQQIGFDIGRKVLDPERAETVQFIKPQTRCHCPQPTLTADARERDRILQRRFHAQDSGMHPRIAQPFMQAEHGNRSTSHPCIAAMDLQGVHSVIHLRLTESFEIGKPNVRTDTASPPFEPLVEKDTTRHLKESADRHGPRRWEGYFNSVQQSPKLERASLIHDPSLSAHAWSQWNHVRE